MSHQESKSQEPLSSQEAMQKDHEEAVTQKDLGEEQLEAVTGGGLGNFVKNMVELVKGAPKPKGEPKAFQLPHSGTPSLLTNPRGRQPKYTQEAGPSGTK